MNRSKVLLILIIFIGAVLRLYHLAAAPAGLNADEAALGYNAYSLLQTGRDEHGHPWPLTLESFGDFKPALYAYILIPFIKVFGLTEFAIRLPSALAGIIAIIFIYALTTQLTNSKLGLIASFVLAVSPWAIHFSRGAWETNVATTLLLTGVWSFVTYLQKRRLWYLLTFVVTFVASIYTYQSTRLLAPVLGLALGLSFARQLMALPKHLTVAIISGLLLLLPFIFDLPSASSRLSGVGLLADVGPQNRAIELRGQHSDWNSSLSRLLHNRPLVYTLRFVSNYLDHFDGNFLFITGDPIDRNHIPETGLLYLIDIILLPLGLVYLLGHPNPQTKIIWTWLLIAPLASSLTFQTPHAVRAHTLVVPLAILSASGVFELIGLLKYWKFIGICGLVIVYCWQVSRYLHQYYVHYPQTLPAAWEYGFADLVPFVEARRANYQHVYVTDKFDQPYILFLFYSHYPPASFQFQHHLTPRDKFNFSTVNSYANYEFRNTSWDQVRDLHSSLIVAAADDIPPVGVNVIKTFYFPSGQPAFKIISN